MRDEFVVPDAQRCLQIYAARGGHVDWPAARKELQRAATEETNPSSHGQCADYFDAATAELVRAADAFLYPAFGYAKCCDGGAASTNSPAFGHGEMAHPGAWRLAHYGDGPELKLVCGRIAAA